MSLAALFHTTIHPITISCSHLSPPSTLVVSSCHLPLLSCITISCTDVSPVISCTTLTKCHPLIISLCSLFVAPSPTIALCHLHACHLVLPSLDLPMLSLCACAISPTISPPLLILCPVSISASYLTLMSHTAVFCCCLLCHILSLTPPAILYHSLLHYLLSQFPCTVSPYHLTPPFHTVASLHCVYVLSLSLSSLSAISCVAISYCQLLPWLPPPGWLHASCCLSCLSACALCNPLVPHTSGSNNGKQYPPPPPKHGNHNQNTASALNTPNLCNTPNAANNGGNNMDMDNCCKVAGKPPRPPNGNSNNNTHVEEHLHSSIQSNISSSHHTTSGGVGAGAGASIDIGIFFVFSLHLCLHLIQLQILRDVQ